MGVLALFFFAIFLPTLCSAQDPYTTLTDAATQLLKQGKLAEAKQTAATATNLVPNRFEAWFIAGVIAKEQGGDAEARPLLEKALALAPEDRKPRIRELLESLPAGAGSGFPSGATLRAAAGAKPLDAAAQRRLNALLIIPEEADRASSPEQRRELLHEFVNKSAAFLSEHPDQTQLWVLYAAAALEINFNRGARIAAGHLLKISNPNEKVQRMLALMERRGLTEQFPEDLTIPDIGLTMVGLPAGSVTMGSPPHEQGRWNGEGPQTRVTVTRAFWLGKYEVTQAQWQAIMGTTIGLQRDKALEAAKRAGASRQDQKDYTLSGEGANFPMYYVSWEEAMEFCRRLTERERAAGRLPAGHVYTLPTEAQWEYACRAESTGAYAGTLAEMAWYSENAGRQTRPVGEKRPNDWGFYDMHGNVWEWCADWYADKLPGGSVRDPAGPASGSLRVNRGGSWAYSAQYCRSAVRSWGGPGDRFDVLGFRPALSAVR